jgi:isocitrate dehydrogenase
MLSIVPLINGGAMFETGAGGSAPKHVQQFIKESHLRWDSLGEFLAISASINTLGKSFNNNQAIILADCLEKGVEKLLMDGKSPSRKVNELDNRGSHFYLALFWAEELAKQDDDQEIKAKFSEVYKALKENENNIVDELNSLQGKPADLGGYYHTDMNKIVAQMRPSAKFNSIIDNI